MTLNIVHVTLHYFSVCESKKFHGMENLFRHVSGTVLDPPFFINASHSTPLEALASHNLC